LWTIRYAVWLSSGTHVPITPTPTPITAKPNPTNKKPGFQRFFLKKTHPATIKPTPAIIVPTIPAISTSFHQNSYTAQRTASSIGLWQSAGQAASKSRHKFGNTNIVPHDFAFAYCGKHIFFREKIGISVRLRTVLQPPHLPAAWGIKISPCRLDDTSNAHI